MGNLNSSTMDCNNDFELVVRVSKELDAFLGGMLGIQSRARDGPSLMQKIEILEESSRICHKTAEKMKKLVRYRNELVHNPKINSLGDMGVDRFSFSRDYDTVKSELTKKGDTSTRGDSGDFSGLGFAAVVGVGLMALALSAGDSDETEEEKRRRRRHQTHF